MLRIATCQMTSGPDTAANLQTAEMLIRRAAREGANLVVLPELFSLVTGSSEEVLKNAETYQDGPIQSVMSALARSLGIWIAAGTLPLKSPEPNHVTNSLLVYDAFGQEAARYDKVHLFSYEGTNERYDESELYTPGHKPVSLRFRLTTAPTSESGLRSVMT